jgi:Flp pilus assembly protein TadG
MSDRTEKGQAIILVLVALSLCLIAMIGLAIDGSQLYAQRQMAQAAADAAAEAGMLSIFNGTNTAALNNLFGSGPFDCGAGDALTPCRYASNNGFDSANGDTVHVEFPPASAEPGVVLSTTYPVNLIRVTIIRPVKTSLMQFLGVSFSRVAAQATAAITQVISPVPILVLHPSMPASFFIRGNPNITITGGPPRSIQVDSKDPCSVSRSSVCGSGGSSVVNLCGAYKGTGADFGNSGGPSPDYPGTSSLNPSCTGGTCSGPLCTGTGQYVQPDSYMQDPLWNVYIGGPPKPPLPLPSCQVNAVPPYNACQGTSNYGCPAATCTLFYPGYYANFPQIKNFTALFIRGLYYIGGGGFQFGANGNAQMAYGMSQSGCPTPDPNTGCGMVVYNTGNGAVFSIPANAGSGSGISLLGAPVSSPYKGILFFEDRTEPAQTHALQGGGAMSLTGTIYLTNDLPLTQGPTGGQQLSLGGNPGSQTNINGQIIVDLLEMHGTASIHMFLDPNLILPINQVALVR